MKPLTRAAAYLLYACGMAVLTVLPVNKYDWMKEMDPSMTGVPTDETSGTRALFAFLVLVAVVATQLAIAIRTGNGKERLISIVLAGVALAVWFVRFGP